MSDEKEVAAVFSGDGRHRNTDPKLIAFHRSRNNPIKVLCMENEPKMYGFGRKLKKGDEVEINGTVYNDGFYVSVPSECAFYDYKCFENQGKEYE